LLGQSLADRQRWLSLEGRAGGNKTVWGEDFMVIFVGCTIFRIETFKNHHWMSSINERMAKTDQKHKI
jgi:hypothetical protein